MIIAESKSTPALGARCSIAHAQQVARPSRARRSPREITLLSRPFIRATAGTDARRRTVASAVVPTGCPGAVGPCKRLRWQVQTRYGAAFVVRQSLANPAAALRPARRDRQADPHSIYGVELSRWSMLGCFCRFALLSLVAMTTCLDPSACMRCRMERLGGQAADGYVRPPTHLWHQRLSACYVCGALSATVAPIRLAELECVRKPHHARHDAERS